MSNNAKSGAKTVGRIALRTLIWIGRIVGTFALVALMTGAIFAVITMVYINNILSEQAAEIDIRDFQLDLTSFIYVRNSDGEFVELEGISGVENRVWTSFNDIPRHVVDAAVAIEDRTFWEHSGVNWRRTIGGGLALLTGGSQFGGSTITQQVIKNVTNNSEATVQRKLTEIMLALHVEETHDKYEIMELYLNTIYLSNGRYGIHTAAHFYFGVYPIDLTIAQGAALVGITNAPGFFNPLVNPQNTISRARTIVWQMREQGLITPEEHDEAQAELDELFIEGVDGERDINNFQANRAPREMGERPVYATFVDQAINDVIRDLVACDDNPNITTRAQANQRLLTGGLTIEITMCMDTQVTMYDVWNGPNFPTTRSRVDLPQAAMTVIDPLNGHILGMAGGRGVYEGRMLMNRAAVRRSPGSSIKSLSVFAVGINENLMHHYSPMLDAPWGVHRGNFFPVNSTGPRGFQGVFTAEHSLRISNNATGFRFIYDNDLNDTVFEYLTERFGLGLFEGYIGGAPFSDRDSLSALSLGSFARGVTTIEMAAAYATFPNRGIFNPPITVERVIDRNGRIMLNNTNNIGRPILEESTAYYINYMLRSAVERGTGTPARISGQIAAGKTGTTDNHWDRYFVGYTAHLVGAVWFGYDIPQRIRLTGITTSPASRLWQQVMSRLHQDLPRREFFTPAAGMVSRTICLDSGLLATDSCRADLRGGRTRSVSFVRGTEPTDNCGAHTNVNICSSCGRLATGSTASTRRVGVLTLDRQFRMPNVVLLDEPFVLHSARSSLRPGMHRPSNRNAGRFNQVCNCGGGGGGTTPPVTSPGPSPSPTPTPSPSPTTPTSPTVTVPPTPPQRTPTPPPEPSPEPVPSPTPEPVPSPTPEPVPSPTDPPDDD